MNTAIEFFWGFLTRDNLICVSWLLIIYGLTLILNASFIRSSNYYRAFMVNYLVMVGLVFAIFISSAHPSMHNACLCAAFLLLHLLHGRDIRFLLHNKVKRDAAMTDAGIPSAKHRQL
ncbi:MAG: hypothetical protein V1738_01865 [Patescibacteria group bacterium]